MLSRYKLTIWRITCGFNWIEREWDTKICNNRKKWWKN